MTGTKRRREEEETSGESLELPEEVIREILIRLPAKSIGRFRCVSKLFRSLSSDQVFARRHLDLTVRRKLIVSTHHDLYSLNLDGIGDYRIIELVAKDLEYPLKYVPCEMLGRMGVRSVVQFIGYSKGLVCITSTDYAFFLYNPTTGDSKRLADLELLYGTEGEYPSHGFGFDDLTNDYKVVKLVPDSTHRLLNASVYSLKSDSWKPIPDDDSSYEQHVLPGMNVNTAIHWVFTLQKRLVILAFNLQTEKFREMALPGDCSHVYRNYSVGVLNGSLCVVNSCYEDHNDIWVMNEYGVASSWTRIRISLLYKCLRPLCSINNNDDEVLLELDEKMVLYNFRFDEWRFLPIRGAELSEGFETHTYVESLISPNL